MHEEKFKEIHERYRHSGLTVKDFCHNEGIAESRFYYWQKKLKNDLSNRDGFVPVVINPISEKTVTTRLSDTPPLIPSSNQPTISSNLSCTITYQSGTSVQLKGVINPEFIKQLLLIK